MAIYNSSIFSKDAGVRVPYVDPKKHGGKERMMKAQKKEKII